MADTQLSTDVWVRDNSNDTAEKRGYVAEALSRMSQSIDTMLTGRVDIIFLTQSQMISGGYTLTDGSAAWGWTTSGAREVRINTANGTNNSQYTILHELGHMVDHDVLNTAKKITIQNLMTPNIPSPSGATWNAGGYLLRPSECFGDTFPRAFSDIDGVLAGWFTRQIAPANYAAYITAITGVGGPAATTLAAASSIGATNIKVVSVTGLSVGMWIAIGSGGDPDERALTGVGTAGAGGTGLTFVGGMATGHALGADVVEIAAPQEPPPPNPIATTAYTITIAGVDYTNRIPAESIRLSESGSDAVATFEYTIETLPGQARYSAGLEEFPADTVYFTDVINNRRLFGGVLVGVTRRHGAGPNLYQDMRCVSYDSWLDRRYVPKWWTTNNGTSTGAKLATDRLIVQALVARDLSGSGVGLTALNANIAETNTNMPKLNLEDGSLRDGLLAVAEAAVTAGDTTPRRVYVDFFKNVHYYKGSESLPAPFRIGNADYSRVVKPSAVAYWPMGEVSGATCYNTQGATPVLTLNGFYVRGVAPGVINQPAQPAIYLAGTGYATTSSASLHPGNVFTIECWFKRSQLGTVQVLFDAGTGDYQIYFEANNTLRVYKKGTGSDFVTTGTFTDTDWHHLMVTHSASVTHVYVDGVDKAGTAAFKTFVPTTNDLYIGADSSAAQKFNGSIQHVAFYSGTLTAVAALANYNDGVTIVPDYIDFDIDYNDSGKGVYVRGSQAAGSGWNVAAGPSPYDGNTIIDRPQSDAAATKSAIEQAFLNRDFAAAKGGHFVVTGAAAWRAGQTVTIFDTGIGVNGSYQIRALELSVPDSGSSEFTYDIYYGSLPWRGTFDIKRKNRKGRNSATA